MNTIAAAASDSGLYQTFRLTYWQLHNQFMCPTRQSNNALGHTKKLKIIVKLLNVWDPISIWNPSLLVEI